MGLRHSIQRRGQVSKRSELFRQPCQRPRQHMDAAADPFRRSVFIRPMAHPAAAGDEQHRRRRNARHKRRVVICARHHLLVRLSRFLRRSLKRTRIAGSQVVGGSAFTSSTAIFTPRRATHIINRLGQRRRARCRAAPRRCRECQSSSAPAKECCSPHSETHRKLQPFPQCR